LPLNCMRAHLALETQKEIISNLIPLLQTCTEAEKIYLFGSFARNEATNWSDIDLLFIVNNSSDGQIVQRKFNKARRGFPIAFDILCVEQSRFEKMSLIGGVCAVVAKEGRVLFERNRN
jgi:uncharacterized protein